MNLLHGNVFVDLPLFVLNLTPCMLGCEQLDYKSLCSIPGETACQAPNSINLGQYHLIPCFAFAGPDQTAVGTGICNVKARVAVINHLVSEMEIVSQLHGFDPIDVWRGCSCKSLHLLSA